MSVNQESSHDILSLKDNIGIIEDEKFRTFTLHTCIYRLCMCEVCYDHVVNTCGCMTIKVNRLILPRSVLFRSAVVNTASASTLVQAHEYAIAEYIDLQHKKTLPYDTVIGTSNGFYIACKSRQRLARLLFAPGKDTERTYRSINGKVHYIPYASGAPGYQDMQDDVDRTLNIPSDSIWIDRADGRPPILLPITIYDLVSGMSWGVNVICIQWDLNQPNGDGSFQCGEFKRGLYIKFSCGDSLMFIGKNHIRFQRRNEEPIIAMVPSVFDLSVSNRVYTYDPQQKTLSWVLTANGQDNYELRIRFNQKEINSILSIRGLSMNVTRLIYSLV